MDRIENGTCEQCKRVPGFVYLQTVGATNRSLFCRECAIESLRGLTPGQILTAREKRNK